MTDRQLELARKWLRRGCSLNQVASNVMVKREVLDLALWANLGRKL
jgi:hypothetical protein